MGLGTNCAGFHCNRGREGFWVSNILAQSSAIRKQSTLTVCRLLVEVTPPSRYTDASWKATVGLRDNTWSTAISLRATSITCGPQKTSANPKVQKCWCKFADFFSYWGCNSPHLRLPRGCPYHKIHPAKVLVCDWAPKTQVCWTPIVWDAADVYLFATRVRVRQT